MGWNKETQKEYGLTYNPIRYVDPWAEQLNEWCKHFNIEFMASIWSEEGFETAKSVNMKRYKISHQMTEKIQTQGIPGRVHKLLVDIIRDGKVVFVSGASNDGGIMGIYCSSDYPTYPEDFEMPDVDYESTVGAFGGRMNEYFGYSDHTHGIAACLLAVARGARYIEKHFTLNKTSQTIRDHPFSATPDEFRTMVDIGREMSKLV